MKEYTEEDVKKAKKMVNEFYNGLGNVEKFNKAIKVFTAFYPDGTFEDLKYWASGKEVKS